MIEYKKMVASVLTESTLKELGNENWDMCGVSGNTFFFKRAGEVQNPLIQKDKVKTTNATKDRR